MCDLTISILYCYAYQQAYRDALRWQFKQLGEPCDISYLYCVDNRLYANSPTPIPRALTSYQNYSFPTQPEAGSSSVLVQVKLPRIRKHYGPPYVEEVIGFRGLTGCMCVYTNNIISSNQVFALSSGDIRGQSGTWLCLTGSLIFIINGSHCSNFGQ